MAFTNTAVGMQAPNDIILLSLSLLNNLSFNIDFTFEPVHEKTNNLGFRPGPTRTGLYSHRRWLDAGNCGFRK